MQNWTEIIRERQESGLTVKDYYAQHGIAEKTYYYWLRKLHAAAAETMEPQLVRLNEDEHGRAYNPYPLRHGRAEAAGGY